MKRPILQAPDERLRRVAKTVHVIDAALAQLAADMVETMEAAKGLGLAAPQVGENVRLIVVRATASSPALVLINPWLRQHGGRAAFDEGCLSLPGQTTRLERSRWVKVVFQDLRGAVRRMRFTDLLAVCIQHELDHLDGVLMTDPREAP